MNFKRMPEVLEVYLGEGSAEAMPGRLGKVLHYLRQGAQRYAKTNGDDAIGEDHENALEMVQTLRDVTERMLVMDNHCIIAQDEDATLNISPLLNWIDDEGMTQLYFGVRGVKEMLVKYLTPDNLNDFYAHHSLMGDWELYFVNEIMENYAKPGDTEG